MDVLGASEHTHSPQRVLTSKHVEVMATAVPVCVLVVLATVAIGVLDVDGKTLQTTLPWVIVCVCVCVCGCGAYASVTV